MRETIAPALVGLTLLWAWGMGCDEPSSTTQTSEPLTQSDDSFVEDAVSPATQDTSLEESVVPDVPDARSSAPCDSNAIPWLPGIPLFEEQTDPWGLTGIEAEYMSILDVDGDGWPDLLVRAGGGPDDFAAGGTRSKTLLRNQGDGTFKDITQSSGLFASRINPSPDYGAEAKVVAAGDVNNDGHVDVFVGRARLDPWTGGTDTSELMLNNGDGTFTLGPEDNDARFPGKPSNPASAVFLDANGDGLLDLWLVHNEQSGPVGVQDTLLLGDGTGAFEDVTIQTGLGTQSWASIENLNSGNAHSWGWGGVACDLDRDGNPELLAASYGRMLNHLWRTNAAGPVPQYVNEGISSGYASDDRVDWTTNLSAQCYCADVPDAEDCDTCPTPQDPAVCQGLAQAFGPNYRWDHNTGREPFSLGGVTGTTVCEDLNNDGLLDLVNFEIVHGDVGSSSDPTEALVNTGETPLRFERPGPETTGIFRQEDTPFWDHGDMTGAVFDVDNDGWKDVYIGAAEYAGNRGWLFRQNAPLSFEAVSPQDSFLQWRAHGVAVADFDRDGDVDMVVGHSHFRCEGFWDTECGETRQVRLFENTFGSQNNWVQIRPLSGLTGGATRIGATVTVEHGDTLQTRVVDGGHGRFGLQGDPTLHFGLGSDCEAEVTVRWPGTEVSHTHTLSANTSYWIRPDGTLEEAP